MNSSLVLALVNLAEYFLFTLLIITIPYGWQSKQASVHRAMTVAPLIAMI